MRGRAVLVGGVGGEGTGSIGGGEVRAVLGGGGGEGEGSIGGGR